MLDTTPDGLAVPNARPFAKVRGPFTANDLSTALADATLMALGDPETAAKLAPAVAIVAQMATIAKLSAEEKMGVVTDALADPKSTTDAGFIMDASARIITMVADQEATNPVMLGGPT